MRPPFLHRSFFPVTSRFALLLALVFASLLPGAHARAAGLLVADGGLGGVLEIVSHDVDVTINNGIAITRVEQVFRNTEDRTVEALYTFPVPKGASVANFSMWINGKEMVGEVVEKERAREIYNTYKQQERPKDPGLLEQVDYKTFEMRIFPIFAGAEQRVRVTYYQELDTDHDWSTYVYPLATTTTSRRAPVDEQTRGRFSLRMAVKSEIPLQEMTSPSHANDFVMADHSPHFHEASLEATGGDLSRDVVLAFRTTRPKTGLDLITSRPEGERGYFLLTLTAGEELEQFAGNGASDYVFVLDISGSMSNEGKLALSRGSLGAFVKDLSPEDRFELLTFNVKTMPLFGELRAADDLAKSEADRYLGQQSARGGTDLAAAVEAAYRYGNPDRPLVVVILSDGLTEQRERRELIELTKARPANARVFAVGVGNDVNRPLLEQVTAEAGGLAAFLSRGDDFERQAQAFRRKLLKPVATNVRLQIEGADADDFEPQTLGNLYHGTPLRLYGRYGKGGPATARLSAEIAGRTWTQDLPITLPQGDGGNPEIERMWAWHRTDRLLKQADASGSRDSVSGEVTRLGEAYSIVTPYTSFIVLENDAEYRRWNIDRRNALRIERDRSAQRKLREQLERLREKAADQVGPPAAPSATAPNREEPQPAAQRQTSQEPTRSGDGRGVDIDVPGGGAIDPLTALAAGLLGGFTLLSRRREA